MTPLHARYAALSQQPDFEPDPAQLQALSALEAVTERINAAHASFARFGLRRPTPPSGLWLWGPVGRGKTLLMDLFFETLAEPRKQRLHFHHFMRHIHRDLTALSGHAEPLPLIAERLAKTTRVLCFDEFFVSDIADAMLLGRLMIELFKHGVFLVATSNLHPQQLYADGLQRQRFLPAIAALQQHCQTHCMDGTKDHRLRQLHQADLFLSSRHASTEQQLQQHLEQYGGAAQTEHQPLTVEGRDIPCRARNQRIAWFSFEALCEGPRSQLDYIALTKRFDGLIVSDIPALICDQETYWVVQGTEDRPASATNQRRFLGSNEDQTRRFISLIDELYDRSVILIASCDVSIAQLYPTGPLAFAFERTRSRLLEMQSQEYLQRQRRCDQVPSC